MALRGITLIRLASDVARVGWDALAEVERDSGSLNAESITSFLASVVSASVVYLLSLIQPLTLGEIRNHPFRHQYVEVLEEGERREEDLSVVIGEGVKNGILLTLESGQESYYFLNSDLVIRPPPLKEEGEAEILIDSSPCNVWEDICLPTSCTPGRDHPIPRLHDPSTCLGWFRWLSDPRRREILMTLQGDGPLSRKELLQRGTESDLRTTLEGIRFGVLRLREDRLDFQFSRTRIPPADEPWTCKPPRFWMTRSYEPLRCIEGSQEYLEGSAGTTPRRLLEEMAEDGKRVRPHRRKGHLIVNLLYAASGVVPRIEEVGPGSTSSVWENERGMVYPLTEGYKRAASVLHLREELALDPEVSGLVDTDESLMELVRRRIDRYLRAREEEVMKVMEKEEVSEYSLGTDALLSVASSALKREKLLEERRYFEKFLELLTR